MSDVLQMFWKLRTASESPCFSFLFNPSLSFCEIEALDFSWVLYCNEHVANERTSETSLCLKHNKITRTVHTFYFFSDISKELPSL